MIHKLTDTVLTTSARTDGYFFIHVAETRASINLKDGDIVERENGRRYRIIERQEKFGTHNRPITLWVVSWDTEYGTSVLRDESRALTL